MAKHLNAALKEAKDLFDFHQNTDRILQWIRDKQLMLTAQDMGKDHEHAKSLLDKLLIDDQSIDNTSIQEVNVLGKKLIAGATGNQSQTATSNEVLSKLKEVNEAWALFQGRMDEYRKMLEDALEVHQFNSEVDDTNGRIQEKAGLLSSDDFGKKLASVEQLLRKQDTIERDMSAIHRKLNDHDNEAKKLLSKDPPLRDSIISSLQKLEISWHQLAQLAHSRRLKLQQSYNLQKYFDSVKKLDNWAIAIRTKMTSYVHPRNVVDAKNLLKAHDECLAEIDSRNEDLKTQTWEAENNNLQKLLQLQTLNSQIQQIESWLSQKENFVNQYNVGDSVNSAESLIRKHENFTQTLIGQSDKMEQLKAGAAILSESNEHTQKAA
uniref:Uncharacterized protein n=1 Tax=Ditylenchus dipsaci TaxID=166011 RepID=A0A915EQJ6_9BILA